jgi:hypothetical protein
VFVCVVPRPPRFRVGDTVDVRFAGPAATAYAASA